MFLGSTFLNCLASTGTNTGTITAICDLNSGNNSIIYNQLYTTGQNYLNGLINSANYPLINLNNLTGKTFLSNNCYQFGNNISGNFSILLEFEPSICNHKTTGINQILLSTLQNSSGVNYGNLVTSENYLLYSNQFINSPTWTNYCGDSLLLGVTPNTTDTLAPDGSYTSTRIITTGEFCIATGYTLGFYQTVSPPLSSGKSYTISLWMKGLVGDEQIRFGINDYNLSTIFLTTNWTRYSYTTTGLIDDISKGIEFANEVPGTYYVWGAQFEYGYGNPGVYVNTTNTTFSGKTEAILSNSFASGFYIGINDANRLYIQSNNSYATLLDYELRTRNFLYLSVNNQYINLGIYDVLNSNFNYIGFQLDNFLPQYNNLYLGNFLNNTLNLYTGFSGIINFASLFNTNLSLVDLSNCVNCYFITGLSIAGTGMSNYQLPIISGYSNVQNIYTGITGYSYISGNIVGKTGNNISVYVSSGITGLISGNIYSVIATGSTNINILGSPIYNYLIDTGIYSKFLTYNVNFYLPLMSGDYVEIYTYNFYNSNVNNYFDSLFNLPNTNLNLNIFDNGLLSLSGFDFGVNEEQEITGLNPNDIIQYDLTTGTTIVTPYSGLWSRSKILMSGGLYFPTNSQYIESGSAIIITGINNNPIADNTDLYLNGQKLISGLQYSVITSDNLNNIYILSGNYLPDFDYVGLYSPTGGNATGITNIESSDLTFYPRENIPNYYLFNPQNTTNTLNNIFGFNPCIFLNGIRQFKNLDYKLSFNCSLVSGFGPQQYGFNFYNSEQTYFNII